MPFWTVMSVEDQPSVGLVLWKIFEVDGDTRHFVGDDTSDFLGRFSSAVVEFDVSTMRGVTQSGRVYELQDNPGDSEQADYVWDKWCAGYGIRTFRYVTQTVVGDARRALAGRELG